MVKGQGLATARIEIHLRSYFRFLFCLDIIFLHFSHKLGEEERSEEGVELRSPVRSVGLAAQLQALRTTLHSKYVQEVAALKEQHNKELRRLREQKELDQNSKEKGERAEDLHNIYSPGCSGESSVAAGQNVHEEKQDWERIEEEVAKVRVYRMFFFFFFQFIPFAQHQ